MIISPVTVTLHGTVVADPELTTVPCKPVMREVYDRAIDDLVEMEFTPADREVRRFSISVVIGTGFREFRCVDWVGFSKLVRQGHRVRIDGQFRKRRYEQNGETRRVSEVVVRNLEFERPPVQEQVS